MPSRFARAVVPCAIATSSILACPRAAQAQEPAPAPAAAPVRIETDGPPLELFERTNEVVMVPRGRSGALRRSFVYAPVCDRTPCVTQLELGAHVLALSKPGGNVVEGDPPVVVDGPLLVRGTYTDRSAQRVTGIVVGALAGVAGGVLMAVSPRTTRDCSRMPAAVQTGGTSACPASLSLDPLLFGAGIGVLVGGMAASLWLMLQHDSVSFELAPVSLGAVDGRREAGALGGGALPNGLQLTLRF